jgi:pre-mRNA-splicing factor SYF1
MLRIKRAVQASFNTENSFIAAQAAAAAKGTEKPTESAKQAAIDAADPMAAMERDMPNGNGNGAGKASSKPAGAPKFVASTQNKINANGIEEAEGAEGGEDANPDAIEVDEDDI